MHRRTFLQHLAVTPVTAASIIGGASYLSMIRKAMAANGKTLVVIFQRGGCDGLNTVIPFGEDEYYRLRPNISIAPPGSGANSAIDLDGFFGFHPALAALQDIYEQGNMAILPAVHYPNGNRSHFSSQDFIESGSHFERLPNGWLNRHLSSFNKNVPLRATSFGELSHSLQGNFTVSVMPDLAKLPSNVDDNISEKLNTLFQEQHEGDSFYRKSLKNHGSLMLNEIDVLIASNYKSYSPENGVTYPNSKYGQQLRQAAHLIKSGLGMEIFTINHNGWDHHVSQGGAEGAQANKLSDFSDGLAALYSDLGQSRMEDVVILTMSEFGRTVKQNASGGTDHGNASCWFAIGGNVSGGIHGEWPGLQPEDLYLERYLKHSIDFRNIFGEVIKNHLGNETANISLDHNYQPIGFL